MSDAVVIKGVDIPEPADFAASASATRARINANASWFSFDFLLYCVLLPMLICLLAFIVIDLIATQPEWRIVMMARLEKSHNYAFIAGFFSCMTMGFLSAPIENLRVRLRTPGAATRDHRAVTTAFTGSGDGLEFAGDDRTMHYKWSAFDDVTRHDGAVLFWRYDSQVCFLPLRSFNSAAEADALFELAEKRIASAKQQPAAP